MKWSKLDEDTKISIYHQYNDKSLRLSYRDLSIKYNVSEKTIYNTVKKFRLIFEKQKPKKKDKTLTEDSEIIKPKPKKKDKLLTEDSEMIKPKHKQKRRVLEPTPKRTYTRKHPEHDMYKHVVPIDPNDKSKNEPQSFDIFKLFDSKSGKIF